MKLSRIGLLALMAVCMAWFVPQAMAAPPTDVFLDPQGAGSGFTSGPAGGGSINCNWTGSAEQGDCQQLALAATDVVTLTATPGPGSTFGGWDGTCPDPLAVGPVCSFTITVASPGVIVIKPLFVNNRTLTVQKTGSGQGTVVSALNVINCGPTCSASAPAGTTFLLTATPAAGSVFTGWTGCTSVNAQNQCAVVLNSNTTVTANFVVVFPLTITLAGSGEGTVTSNTQPPLNCGVPGGACNASVASGATIQLTAAPAAGSIFTGFTGCTAVNGNVCTVTVSGAANVTATFQPAAVQAEVTGNNTRCTGPRAARRQLRITIAADQAITVVVRLRNSSGTTVQRKTVVKTHPDNFQITMNIGNGKPNGKYTAQVTMTNQFGASKVQTRNVKLKSC